MAITYPRDLPDTTKIASCVLEQGRNVTRSPTVGGAVQRVELASPLWSISYETVPLVESDGEAWAAWLASLRAGAKLFKAVMPLRRYALAYRSGYGGLTRAGTATAFDGTATVSAVGGSLDTLTLSTLPAAFQLKAGDLLSLGYASGAQGFHRIVEGATASGAGAATVTIEPTLKASGASGRTVQLLLPWFKAALDGEGQVRWSQGRIARVSFRAIQVAV